MALSKSEAAEALRDIAQTERRSVSAYGYKASAPHLILWGIVWFLGYGGTYLFPVHGNVVWPGLALAGSVISTLLGIYSKPRRTVKFSWRIMFTWLAALGAIGSIFAIFAPVNGMQVGSLFPLVIGWSYVVLGIWMGWRFSLAGAAIVALTLFGFFRLSPENFLLCMAFLGATILIGTGVWLRRA